MTIEEERERENVRPEQYKHAHTALWGTWRVDVKTHTFSFKLSRASTLGVGILAIHMTCMLLSSLAYQLLGLPCA